MTPPKKAVRKGAPARRAASAAGAGKKAARPASDAPRARKTTTPVVRAPKPGAAPRVAAPRRATARRPAFELVRGTVSGDTAPAAFRQRAGASSRQLQLFNLVRARTRVQAAVQGLVPGAAERPIGEGRWNAREIVLHLHFKDRETLDALESALHGIRPSWHDYDRGDFDRANAIGLAGLRHMPWDEALRALHIGRQALVEAIESIPELPADVWDTTHPLGELLHALSLHDLHHADAIKRWRAGAGA
jgi:hypothetical protein